MESLFRGCPVLECTVCLSWLHSDFPLQLRLTFIGNPPGMACLQTVDSNSVTPDNDVHGSRWCKNIIIANWTFSILRASRSRCWCGVTLIFTVYEYKQ